MIVELRMGFFFTPFILPEDPKKFFSDPFVQLFSVGLLAPCDEKELEAARKRYWAKKRRKLG